MELMTTTQVWEGFDATELELDSVLLSKKEDVSSYTYLAKRVSDGDVTIDIKVYSPNFESQNVVLLVGSYTKIPQKGIIDDLVKKGYIVCLPDFGGILENTATVFPESLDYGYYAKAGNHANKMCLTPIETTQYLYAVIIRRAITFINKILNKEKIVIMGLSDGVEIAMQVAGEEKRINGLVCINGASYLEYVKHNKYDSEEMIMDDDMLSWLTGVSSTSYAKKIQVPVMFAIGSNGTLSDIDRLSNIFNIIQHNKIRAVISAKYIDNIDYRAYNSVVSFIKYCFVGSMPPEMPDIELDFNEDGTIYANVLIDNIIEAEKVRVFYSVGEYNHATRYWQVAAGESAGLKEYIAKLNVKLGDSPLFVFAEIQYKNGLLLSSLPYFHKLPLTNETNNSSISSPIVFYYNSNIEEFTEVSSDEVILEGSVREGTLPIGLKGICCDNGSLISFAIGNKNKISKDKILQVDAYSDVEDTMFSITAITSGENNEEFTAKVVLDCEDSFVSLKFDCSDFKNAKFMPLMTWSQMKGIRINNNKVVIGKIMFL